MATPLKFGVMLLLSTAFIAPAAIAQEAAPAPADPAQADDALWVELHAEFSEPELVELGYWIGFTFGGQRWLKTLNAKQGELEASLKR